MAIDLDKGRIEERQTLRLSGDSGHAGMVLKGSELLASDYSSHEGRTSIYLARLRVREP